MGGRSLGGSIYWKTNLAKIYKFMLRQDESILKIAEAGPIEVTILSCLSRKNANNIKKNNDQI